MQAYYFGYREHSGHFLRDTKDKYVLDAHRLIPAELHFPDAWDRLMDTGLLKNGKVPDRPDGRVRWTCSANKWFAFIWWDRSGDKRPGSNSGFYVHGFELDQVKEAFAFACAAYPDVVARQLIPLTLAE